VILKLLPGVIVCDGTLDICFLQTVSKTISLSKKKY